MDENVAKSSLTQPQQQSPLHNAINELDTALGQLSMSVEQVVTKHGAILRGPHSMFMDAKQTAESIAQAGSSDIVTGIAYMTKRVQAAAKNLNEFNDLSEV